MIKASHFLMQQTSDKGEDDVAFGIYSRPFGGICSMFFAADRRKYLLNSHRGKGRSVMINRQQLPLAGWGAAVSRKMLDLNHGNDCTKDHQRRGHCLIRSSEMIAALNGAPCSSIELRFPIAFMIQ